MMMMHGLIEGCIGWMVHGGHGVSCQWEWRNPMHEQIAARAGGIH